MKNAAASLIALLLSAGAAACPLSKAVTERYGITDGGMLTPLPLAKPNADPAFLWLSLSSSNLISDGFHHTLFVDRQARRAWLRRTGGLLGVREWFGPIDVSGDSLAGCSDADMRRNSATTTTEDFAGFVVHQRKAPHTP